MADCLISFGSNQGDGARWFSRVVQSLRDRSEVMAVRSSQLVRTRPVGAGASQPAFQNAAIRLSCRLSPVDLYRCLRSIEESLGRIRLQRWGPRTVDLDLLLYDQIDVRIPLGSESLILPHPRMAFRRFVLQPAREVAAEMIHAPSHMTITELLNHLDTQPNVVALLGKPEWIGDVVDELERRCRERRAGQSMAESKEVLSPDCRFVEQINPSEFAMDSSPFAITALASDDFAQSTLAVTKLLVFGPDGGVVVPESSRLWRRARSWSGPRLELFDASGSEAAIEIAAALEAMLPASVI